MLAEPHALLFAPKLLLVPSKDLNGDRMVEFVTADSRAVFLPGVVVTDSGN
jgi:hypothetical protein